MQGALQVAGLVSGILIWYLVLLFQILPNLVCLNIHYIKECFAVIVISNSHFYIPFYLSSRCESRTVYVPLSFARLAVL